MGQGVQKLEIYRRPRGYVEWKDCHGLEKWVWWNGGLIRLSELREEFQRRLKLAGVKPR